MFKFDLNKNLVLGAMTAFLMVGCQSTGSSLYEEMDVQQVSLENYLEEQDGSLEEWEQKEQEVAQKIAAGDYELSETGLLADNSGDNFVDPMSGAMGDWGDAPEEIAETEADTTIINEDATPTVADASARLGKLAAGKDIDQEISPVLAGDDTEVALKLDEASASGDTDAVVTPAATEMPSSDKTSASTPGDEVPMNLDASTTESEDFSHHTADPAVQVMEASDYHLQDLDEDTSIALLMGDGEDLDLEEDAIDASASEYAAIETIDLASDQASLVDGSTVSDGVYVKIKEPRRIAAHGGEGGWLEDLAEEQDAFLAAIIGDSRDVEAWEEEAPSVMPEFYMDDMELVAFDLPEKMDADIEDLTLDSKTYEQDMQQMLAQLEPTAVEVPAGTDETTAPVMVASLTSPYAGIAANLEDSNGDVDFDAFITSEMDSIPAAEPATIAGGQPVMVATAPKPQERAAAPALAAEPQLDRTPIVVASAETTADSERNTAEPSTKTIDATPAATVAQAKRQGMPERTPQRRVRKSTEQTLQVLAAKQAQRRLDAMVANVQVEEELNRVVKTAAVADTGSVASDAPKAPVATVIAATTGPQITTPVITAKIQAQPVAEPVNVIAPADIADQTERRIIMASAGSVPVLDGAFTSVRMNRVAVQVAQVKRARQVISMPMAKVQAKTVSKKVVMTANVEPRANVVAKRLVMTLYSETKRPTTLAAVTTRYTQDRNWQKDVYPSSKHYFRPIKEVPFKEQEETDPANDAWHERRMELVIPKRLRIETV